METLQIKKEDALTAFEQAGSKGKKLLKNLFGSKVFVKDIMELVRSYEDACQVLGLPVNYTLKAADRLKIIIKALNQGWIPDYSNSNQTKFYPYFVYAAGSGFALRHVFELCTHAAVGAPFVLASRPLAHYVGTQFKDLYNEMLTDAELESQELDPSILQHMAEYKEACVKLNMSDRLPDVSMLPQREQNFHLANHMLMRLTGAENMGVKMDFNDGNQRKYFPVWDLESKGSAAAGSGFALVIVNERRTIAAVGAPFMTTEEKKTRTLADKYPGLYRHIILPMQF